MTTNLIVRAVFFTIALPGVVAFATPCLILRRAASLHMPRISALTVAAAAFWTESVAALLHSIWGFAMYGEGTLAPVDPPKHLVVRGLYRYTRNPMYLAVGSMLLSEAILFSSGAVLAYAALCGLLFDAFVMCYEEPTLQREFGPLWEQYCRAVPRWGIARSPYIPTTGAT
jgi:protein-S-isoprenylcysteine O-methyltransferase Ste14